MIGNGNVDSMSVSMQWIINELEYSFSFNLNGPAEIIPSGMHIKRTMGWNDTTRVSSKNSDRVNVV